MTTPIITLSTYIFIIDDMKHYIHTGLFALAILVAVASCSKDDPFEAGTGLTKITAPEVTCTASTYRSLSFSWTPVDGAVQYSYSLKDAAGNLYGGNVTYGTKAFFDGLSSDYPYVFSVIAYPGLDSGKEASSEASLTQKTGLVNNEGTFTSYLASGTWKATLQESSLNTFVLKNWYGQEGYDLEFTVNPVDSTVTVTNGTPDTASGRMIVATGSNKINVKNGVLIDGAKSKFYRLDGMLILNVQASMGSRQGEDTFIWQ